MISSLAEGSFLKAAGLVALADMETIAYRTSLTGTASYLDILFLIPGIHRQQRASSQVNAGEYPITGAMTTGYVFRVENQATVSYLQRVGRTGHLTTVEVSDSGASLQIGGGQRILTPSSLYYVGIALTIASTALLATIHDWWALGALGALMLARLVNVVIIRRRVELGWKGAAEPGVPGDLIILLSQDRWVRMRGLVDDLKVVTSGEWLREMKPIEEFGAGFVTVLVYASVAIAFNASTLGGLVIAALLLVSVALLGLCNLWTTELEMFGKTVRVREGPTPYPRRMAMVKELTDEIGTDDWAVAMGLQVGAKVVSV